MARPHCPTKLRGLDRELRSQPCLALPTPAMDEGHGDSGGLDIAPGRELLQFLLSTDERNYSTLSGQQAAHLMTCGLWRDRHGLQRVRYKLVDGMTVADVHISVKHRVDTA